MELSGIIITAIVAVCCVYQHFDNKEFWRKRQEQLRHEAGVINEYKRQVRNRDN